VSKSNTTENDFLKMALQGTDPAWRAGATQWIAMHKEDPGEAGSAVTNEADYGGYLRFAVTKATAWTDGGSTFSNAVLIQFPQCTSGTNTLKFWSVVTTASGAGQIIYSAALTSNLDVSLNIQPQFAPGALTVTED
jgi:hypothetical protein